MSTRLVPGRKDLLRPAGLAGDSKERPYDGVGTMRETELERLQELLDEMARVDMQIAPVSGIEERALKRLDATPSVSSGLGQRTRVPAARVVAGAGALAAVLFLIVFLNARPRVPPDVPGPVALSDIRARTTTEGTPPTPAAASTVSAQPV